MWDHPFKHLVSARDRLMHFKFVHRIYFTLARLSAIYPSVSSECWRCSCSPADAIYIFWECALIRAFWGVAISCIEGILKVPIPLSIRACLLSLVEEVVPYRALRTLLNILFFYGRKAILLK